MTRFDLGKVAAVLGGVRRMQPLSDEAAKAIVHGGDELDEHRGRPAYRKRRHGGYPLGSGGSESSNTFLCHVWLKRPGAWWYASNRHQRLALRCAT